MEEMAADCSASPVAASVTNRNGGARRSGLQIRAFTTTQDPSVLATSIVSVCGRSARTPCRQISDIRQRIAFGQAGFLARVPSRKTLAVPPALPLLQPIPLTEVRVNAKVAVARRSIGHRRRPFAGPRLPMSC